MGDPFQKKKLMITKYCFFLWLLLMCGACSYLKNVRLLTNGSIARKNFVQALPFEYKKGLIVVKARVNADTTLREFIFDTGAFNSKIENGLAQQLALTTVTTKSNSDSNGNTRNIEVTKLDSIQFGETRFYNIGAGKVNYGEQSASPCIAPHGIIGANLIQLAHWKVDFEQQVLYFSDRPFPITTNTITYQLPFSTPTFSGLPRISIQLNGKTLEDVVFDLGYNGGLILPATLASHFDDQPKKLFLDQATSGIYGTRADSLISQELTLNLGGASMRIPIDFSANGKGLLGNEILEHYLVYLDYDSEIITLQRKNEVSVSPNLSFIPGVLNDSLWIVNRIQSGSELQLGDTLKSINDTRPDQLFSTHCEYIMNIGTWLNQDSLVLEKNDGSLLILTNQQNN